MERVYFEYILKDVYQHDIYNGYVNLYRLYEILLTINKRQINTINRELMKCHFFNFIYYIIFTIYAFKIYFKKLQKKENYERPYELRRIYRLV